MASLTMSQSLLVKPFRSVRAQPAQRSCRLMVRAQAQKTEGGNLPATLRDIARNPAVLAVAANVLATMPAHAETGQLFDFGLTLPVMVGEFLLLMVFLDKTWFGPVGAKLDERDAMIRSKLAAFKGNTDAVAKLQAEAESIIAEARKEAQNTVMAAKAEAQEEAAKKLAAVKEKVDKELVVALAALDKEKEAALSNLDAQVDKLSADILARILPEGVKV